MHVCFIPYGKRSEVELMLRDMEAQKHLMKLKKDGEEKEVFIQGVVRLMPLGFYEYVFPKEDIDLVLTTLTCDITPYGLNKTYMNIIKKLLKLKNIPKFKKDKTFMWLRENVSIIPLGIREDGVIVEPEGTKFPGWEHERL